MSSIQMDFSIPRYGITRRDSSATMRRNGIRKPMPIARMAISSLRPAKRRSLAGILVSGRTAADGLRISKKIQYTSASVNTAEKKEFLYGRVEVRAKIPTAGGAWLAIWLLGRGMDWPSNGEIDMMEYYRRQGVPHILANACWGTDKPWTAKWNSKAIPFTHFTDRDAQWADKFHVWRMDWDEQSIRLNLDDELLNEISQAEAVNGKLGNGEQPFKKPQYLLLNLALGGDNGGEIDDSALPMKYLIDYVRVYQKK